jgi:hypothetical protein
MSVCFSGGDPENLSFSHSVNFATETRQEALENFHRHAIILLNFGITYTQHRNSLSKTQVD